LPLYVVYVYVTSPGSCLLSANNNGSSISFYECTLFIASLDVANIFGVGFSELSPSISSSSSSSSINCFSSSFFYPRGLLLLFPSFYYTKSGFSSFFRSFLNCSSFRFILIFKIIAAMKKITASGPKITSK